MKYIKEVQINLPPKKVIELFDNTENLSMWPDGLISFDHIDVEHGQEGANQNCKVFF